MKKFALFIVLIVVLSFNAVHAQSSYAYVDRLEKKCNKGKTKSCEKLKEIALKDTHPGIRKAAVLRISDNRFLEEIVKKEGGSSVSMAALKQITDQNFLIGIATSSKYMEMRRIAVGNLNNQIDILKILAIEKEAWVREMAVSKISDESRLLNFVKEDTDFTIRETALKGITSQNYILDIVKESDHLGTRILALNRLNGNEFYDDMVEIIANFDDYKRSYGYKCSFSAIAALKIIPQDNILKGHHGNLVISIDIKSETKQYGNRRTWRRLLYNIEIKTDKLKKSFLFRGRGGSTIEHVSGFSRTHVGGIDIYEICNFLLSSFSQEDLLKISNESDVYYLRQEATYILKGKKAKQ